MENCPYCDAEIEISHDDGQGYEQDCTHSQECEHCNKTFVFTTYISFSYDLYKADCLNGADHKYSPTITFPKQFTKMRCEMCDETRPCTEEELKAVLTNPQQ